MPTSLNNTSLFCTNRLSQLIAISTQSISHLNYQPEHLILSFRISNAVQTALQSLEELQCSTVFFNHPSLLVQTDLFPHLQDLNNGRLSAEIK